MGIVQVHQQPPALFTSVYQRKRSGISMTIPLSGSLLTSSSAVTTAISGAEKSGVVPRPLNGKSPCVDFALLFEILPQLGCARSYFHLARADPAELRAQVFQNRFIIALHKNRPVPIFVSELPVPALHFSPRSFFAAKPYRSIKITSAACATPFSSPVSLSSR